MAEKKKRIRRSREELMKDPNFRDQSGGNRSRKVDGKSRKARGVDGRFSDPRKKINELEQELEISDRQIEKWRDRLEVANESKERAEASNRKQKELKKAGKIRMASIQFGADTEPARKMLSQSLDRSRKLEKEIGMWKSKL